MTKIKVEQPFTVRREGEPELLAFTTGVHEVDEDVLKHWFVQACITDGRAVLLGEDTHVTEPGLEPDQEPDQAAADKKAQKRTRPAQEQA